MGMSDCAAARLSLGCRKIRSRAYIASGRKRATKAVSKFPPQLQIQLHHAPPQSLDDRPQSSPHHQTVCHGFFLSLLLFSTPTCHTSSRLCVHSFSATIRTGAPSRPALHPNTSSNLRKQQEKENAAKEGSQAGEGAARTAGQQSEEWDCM